MDSLKCQGYELMQKGCPNTKQYLGGSKPREWEKKPHPNLYIRVGLAMGKLQAVVLGTTDYNTQ